MTLYFDALNAAVNAAAQSRWPGGDGQVKYVNLVTHNCGLTALLVFARSDVAGDIAWTDTAEVGVGVHETGNKGAVGARLGYSTTRNETVDLTFVAAHIAPMEDAYDRRNQDWKSIVERLVFTKSGNNNNTQEVEDRDDDADEDASLLLREQSSRQSSMFTPRSHLFFAGDLNYRTSDAPPTPEDYARFPQPDAPLGDPIHHSQLFAKDQLTRELRAQNTLHGLSEAPIKFPPTYKYSSKAQKAAGLVVENEPKVWQWARHRWPSWCDRILYLDLPPWMKDNQRGVEVHGYDALPLFSTSDHRAVALAVSVPLKPIPRPPSPSSTDDVRLHPPFSIDPDWKAKRESARTKEMIVGGFSYLALTREGNGFLLAGTIGLVGCWFVLQSLLLGDM